MGYGLHQPIPGGSTFTIEYQGPKVKEVITIYLPPVGYTIDRIPQETGMPSFELVPCEILGEDLPVEEQKWKRPKLPKQWRQWRREEIRQQQVDPNWVHPEAEKFRAREWRRRINGCWQAIGNRNGKPTEYVYIPPTAYYYFAWWEPDFGHPKFRLVYLKTFLALQWAEDHPLVRGIVLSTHRRHGKTSIAGCWTTDLPSRMKFGYGGMQGQAGKKALEFFDIHLMQPFRRLVDFFRPKFDAGASVKSALVFVKPAERSNKAKIEEPDLFEIEESDEYLGGRITCVTSSETALDGKKVHRIWLDECFAPGTKILCEGFVFRPIEEIQVGDRVIVEGGELVEVAQTCQGEDEMFLVKQPYGKDYVVNSKHKLYLRYNKNGKESIVEITPPELLNYPAYARQQFRRVTSSGLHFNARHHFIPSYLLGLWLGDGRYGSMSIIVNIEEDPEIRDYLRDYALKNNFAYKERKSDSNKCVYITISSPSLDFIAELKRLKVYKNKHIPTGYFLDSYENRMHLLAGLIDTDGHANREFNNIQLAFANKRLAEDAQKLAMSLGFSVSALNVKTSNFNTLSYRISITGDLFKIPTRVNRKKFSIHDQHARTGRSRDRIEVTSIGLGRYYGITLKTEQNHRRRLVHEDFTILKNCGKWQRTDVYKTVLRYVPCTSNELRQKIGLLFVPSTVEDLDEGGEQFIQLAENSLPSQMAAAKNGKTPTELVFMFISAVEGVVFEEYGRSVIDDPKPGEIVLDELGKPIKEGAKTFLSKERESKLTEQDRIEEIRKYPWSWFEAKMTMNDGCHFNQQILTTRLQQLNSMQRMPWIRGNYEWANEVDGDVIFVRDDIGGRFQVAWMPDTHGGQYEKGSKLINNVGVEWSDGKPYYYPRNDRLFIAGADPIQYKTKGKDKRLSNGAAHIFRKYDPTVDQGKDIDQWESYNFIVQYLYRPPTFEMYAEDMIKMVRYWGCSINAEDNVQNLRQHFDSRGYGAFIIYRRDIDDRAVHGNGDLDRPVRTNAEVIDYYVKTLNTYFFRHGMRCMFAELLEQGLQFDANDTQKYDAIVSAGYTLMGLSKRVDDDSEDEAVDITAIIPMYSMDGWKQASNY